LHEQGKRVLHVSFKNQTINDSSFSSSEDEEICIKNNVPYLSLDLTKASVEYMGRKLGSKTIAGWITKAPFFKALVNMIPGFNYLIYLGKVFELIKASNNELICVLDSPSSGHALTMMESTQNFRDIFQSGIIFDDTNKMLKLMYQPGFTQMTILTTPTEMAIHEAFELKDDLAKLGTIDTKVFSNNSYALYQDDIEAHGPEFLKEKLSQEIEVLSEYKDQLSADIPHCLATNQAEILSEIVPLMKSLV
ncbi:hypothetical protein N9B72_01265, partial [Bacteriovoracaceae bacterium]|nr:hypothetical protein [Bacteriovoracaceae bacterium]